MVNSRDNRARSFTLSVPVAGKRYYDLSRNASYEAARRGDLPITRVGRLLRVPVLALEKKIEQAGGVGRDPLQGALEPQPRRRTRKESGTGLREVRS